MTKRSFKDILIKRLIEKNVKLMKGQKYPDKGSKKLFLAILILFFTSLGFNNKSYSQGWTFTFNFQTSGFCPNGSQAIGIANSSLPQFQNFGIPTKSQCIAIQQQITSIFNGYSIYDCNNANPPNCGYCNISLVCTPCTGSDIIVAGQTTPGQVTFEQGKPVFTPHESEAFQNWARDYKQQLESYGITSILGKNIIPNQLPASGDKPSAVPASGDKNMDKLYSDEVLSYEFPEQGGEVDLSHLGDKPGVVDPNDLKNDEGQSQGGAGLSEGEPLLLPDDLNPDELMDALEKIRDEATDPELRALAENVIDLLNYLISLQYYNPSATNNSNYGNYGVSTSNSTSSGYSPVNPGTNSSPAEVKQDPNLSTLDKVGLLQGTVDYVAGLRADYLDKTIKATSVYRNLQDIMDLNALQKYAKVSGILSLPLGTFSLGSDINEVYKDLTTGESLAKTGYDISVAVADYGLLVAGVAGVVGVAGVTTVASPLVLFGAGVFLVASKYYVNDNKIFKSKNQ